MGDKMLVTVRVNLRGRPRRQTKRQIALVRKLREDIKRVLEKSRP